MADEKRGLFDSRTDAEKANDKEAADSIRAEEIKKNAEAGRPQVHPTPDRPAPHNPQPEHTDRPKQTVENATLFHTPPRQDRVALRDAPRKAVKAQPKPNPDLPAPPPGLGPNPAREEDR